MNDQAGDSSRKPQFRRTRRWIRPDLQLKVVLRTVFVAVLALVIQFQLSLFGFWLLLQRGGATDAVPRMLLKYFCLALAIAVPLGIVVGIAGSFSYCGPVFRFSKFLHGLLEGRWDRPCTIRKSDDLHDFNELLNAALERMTERMRRQHELVEEARSVLEAAELAGETQERARALLGAIEEEREEFRRRFPEESPAEAAAEDATRREREVAV